MRAAWIIPAGCIFFQTAMYLLPKADVLVAESNGPPRPDDLGGIKGWVNKLLRKRAGGNVPSVNRITLLRDTNGDASSEAGAGADAPTRCAGVVPSSER